MFYVYSDYFANSLLIEYRKRKLRKTLNNCGKIGGYCNVAITDNRK